ncbi:hypothetical protein IAT38_002774 [Cryptococcus sp. DSM 104549]
MSTSRRSRTSTANATSSPAQSAPAAAGPSNSRGGRRAQDADAEEDEDAEDEDAEEQEVEPGWTEDDFQDVSIDRSTRGAIASLDATVDNIREAIQKLEEGIELARETAIAIEEAGPDEEAIKNIEPMIFKAIDQREILTFKKKALSALINRLKSGDRIEDIYGQYNDDVSQKEREYLAKSNRAKYKTNEHYVTFRHGIWEVNHPSTACPPLSQWLEKGDGEESDDSDIDMGGQTQTYRCPLTLQHYKKATTCTKCNHSFSHAAIVDHIQKGRGMPVRCPVTGCAAKITMADLKDDPSLQKRADAFESRKQRRDDEDEEDAIDVIDDSDED